MHIDASIMPLEQTSSELQSDNPSSLKRKRDETIGAEALKPEGAIATKAFIPSVIIQARWVFSARLDTVAKLSYSFRRFDNNFFTIHVAEQIFVVHATILCKSPVFAAMSREPFKESQTRVFELSDDDPVVFALFIECLYSAREKLPELDDLRKEFSDPKDYWSEVLARLYVLGDKYSVVGVQKSVVDACRAARLYCRQDARSFFRMAEIIYGHTSSTSNDQFRVWFRKVANMTLERMNEDTKYMVHDLLRRGNDLSIDIFEAQQKAMEALHAKNIRLQKLEEGSPALVDAKRDLILAKVRLEETQTAVDDLEDEIHRLVQELD